MVRQTIPQLMPENYAFSDYARKKITSYNEEALNSVRNLTFTQYCKDNLRKKDGFFSKVESDPLKYRKKIIGTSLTYLSSKQNEIALIAF
jgi:hypothetical protein